MTRLLLIGSGLPHLVVLEGFRRNPPGRGSVTLLSGDRLQAHPGMVPGYLAGRYPLEEIRVDLAEAAGAAGMAFTEGRVRTLHAGAGRVELESGIAIEYELASIALDGASIGDGHSRGSAHGIGSLAQVDALAGALDALAATPRPEPRRIVILGANELGVELALATRARLDRRGASDVIITILESRSELFGGRLRPWADRVERVLAERDIILRLGTGAAEVGADFVRQSDGRVQPADLVLSAAGPGAWAPLRGSGLSLDGQGNLLLEETLQAQGSATHFGAGPGTALLTAPRALHSMAADARMGRVLARNLATVLAGAPPTRRFIPRARELTLLDAGDGRAVLLGGPVAAVSRWALRYKQMGDRRLVNRLRATPQGGTATRGQS